MPTPTRSWRQSTGRMSALAAASISDVVGYALRNSAPSILRMRAMASTTLTLRAPLASRLREEDRDLSCGLRLVFLERRIRRHGELPQSRPLGQIGRAHVELQSRLHLVCRLLLEKKKNK